MRDPEADALQDDRQQHGGVDLRQHPGKAKNKGKTKRNQGHMWYITHIYYILYRRSSILVYMY